MQSDALIDQQDDAFFLVGEPYAEIIDEYLSSDSKKIQVGLKVSKKIINLKDGVP